MKRYSDKVGFWFINSYTHLQENDHISLESNSNWTITIHHQTSSMAICTAKNSFLYQCVSQVKISNPWARSKLSQQIPQPHFPLCLQNQNRHRCWFHWAAQDLSFSNSIRLMSHWPIGILRFPPSSLVRRVSIILHVLLHFPNLSPIHSQS